MPMVERERRAWQGDIPVEEVIFLGHYSALIVFKTPTNCFLKPNICYFPPPRWESMSANAQLETWSSLARVTQNQMQKPMWSSWLFRDSLLKSEKTL